MVLKRRNKDEGGDRVYVYRPSYSAEFRGAVPVVKRILGSHFQIIVNGTFVIHGGQVTRGIDIASYSEFVGAMTNPLHVKLDITK